MKIIYKLTNKINGKSYIGQTNNLYRRMHQHKGGKTTCNFHKAIAKYGWDAFELEVLEEGLTQEEASDLEEYWIEHYDSVSNGYNMLRSDRDNPSFNREVVAKRTYILLNDPVVNAKLSIKGEDSARSIYTEAQVKEIRKRRMAGERMSTVYEDYKDIGVGGKRNGFSEIWLHTGWKHVMPEFENKYPPVNPLHYAAIPQNNLVDTDLEKISKYVQHDVKFNSFYPEFRGRVDWNTFQKICKELLEAQTNGCGSYLQTYDGARRNNLSEEEHEDVIAMAKANKRAVFIYGKYKDKLDHKTLLEICKKYKEQ